MFRACSCAMRTISFSSRLRTSNPHGQRRLFRSAMAHVLPLVPVGVHPNAHLRLALEQLAEELADLRRSREALDALEARPGVDAQERLRILRVEIDRVREVAGLLRGVLGRASDLVVVLLRWGLTFAESRSDGDGVLHRFPPVACGGIVRRHPCDFLVSCACSSAGVWRLKQI